MNPNDRYTHASLVHGLESYACMACQPGQPCDICNGHGVLFYLDRRPCSRPDCPIGRKPS